MDEDKQFHELWHWGLLDKEFAEAQTDEAKARVFWKAAREYLMSGFDERETERREEIAALENCHLLELKEAYDEGHSDGTEGKPNRNKVAEEKEKNLQKQMSGSWMPPIPEPTVTTSKPAKPKKKGSK